MMSFLGLFTKEKQEAEFDLRARAVLFHVRQGATPRQAAQTADVSADELAAWKRSPDFRHALKRAKTDPPGLAERGICSLNDPRISGPGEFGYDLPYDQALRERLHPRPSGKDPEYGPR